jgi:hypothetical protein
MNRISVSSSHLVSVGYDPLSHTLEIEFKDGSVYQYYNVPSAIYQGLMNASSQGIYFHAHIEGKYQYRKMN